jgi:putative toxin-antitoxin system antitoxin component (TIGR02293 family)
MARKQQRSDISRNPTGHWIARDARSGRFTSIEGHSGTDRREQEVGGIMALAISVVGSREAAERWLVTPVPALDGARPKDLLRTKVGAARVREALHQIEHGIFA